MLYLFIIFLQKTVVFLSYNVLVVFGIRHSEIPERPLGRYETRQVDVGIPSTRYPNCKMRPRDNHEYKEKWEEYKKVLATNTPEAKAPDKDPFITYYVKKRLTIQPEAMPGPSGGSKRYQIVATREPLDEKKHMTGRPNEFTSQIGSIHGENAKIGLLKVLPRSLGCGIEQYLAGLCFLDEEVNQITSESYQLDMDQIFSHYGKGEINDIGNVRAQVEGHCNNVIEVYLLGGSGPSAHPSAKRLRAIMEGARY